VITLDWQRHSGDANLWCKNPTVRKNAGCHQLIYVLLYISGALEKIIRNKPLFALLGIFFRELGFYPQISGLAFPKGFQRSRPRWLVVTVQITRWSVSLLRALHAQAYELRLI
jgi:hypothetical protein